MATYHLTVKQDKKPNGEKVTAKNHLDYISRNGKFALIDMQNDIKLQTWTKNNMIIMSEMEDNQYQTQLLYKSPFGSIKQDLFSLKITDNASLETIDTGLLLCLGMYKTQNIDIKGDDNFKAKTIMSAAQLNLPIKFKNDVHQNLLEKIKEEIKKNERGNDEIRRRNTDNKPGEIRFNSSLTLPTVLTAIERCDLSEMYGWIRNLDEISEPTGMLLQQDTWNILGQQESERLIRLRRSIRNATRRRIKAEKTVAEIIELQKNKTSAKKHLEYINREDKFAAKGGCIFQEHHLPKWAKDDPKKFFDAADKYERKNGVRYKEIEFALPNELNLEQQKEIINEMINKHFKDYYYAYAIHDKIGVMSEGQHNIHVHFMFSTRLIDEEERRKERSAKTFFSNPARNPKTTADIRKGGCRKDTKWKLKDENGKRNTIVEDIRKDYAEIVNKTLKKYGYDIEISHKSLADQRKDALEKADYETARKLDRKPEEHIDIRELNKHPELIEEIKNKRKERNKDYQKEKEADNISTEIEEINKENSPITDPENDEPENINLDIIDPNTENITEAKNNYLSLKNEYNLIKNSIIQKEEIDFLAEIIFLTEKEKINYKEYHELLKEIEKTNKKISSVNNSDDENETKNIITEKLNNDLIELNMRKKSFEKILEPVLKKIETHKESIDKEKQKIQLKNKNALSLMKTKKEALNNAYLEYNNLINQKYIDKITNLIEDKIPKYSAKSIVKILKEINKNLNKKKTLLENKQKELNKNVISKERAKVIAENILTKHQIKNNKEIKNKLEQSIKKMEALLNNPLSKKISDYNEYIKLNMNYEKKKIELKTINKKIEQLEEYCNKNPERINKIIAGIMEKNYPEKVKAIKNQKLIDQINKKIKNTEKLIEGAEARVKFDEKMSKTYAKRSRLYPNQYKVNTTKIDLSNIYNIANAFNGNKTATLVAQLDKYDKINELYEASKIKTKEEIQADLENIGQ